MFTSDELLRTRHHDNCSIRFPFGESVLCSFVSDHLKHIEERGMWYMRDSCSWDTRFVSGFDILRKLHLLFNNRFFSPTKQTWNLENNSSNQQIFQHFIFLGVGGCIVYRLLWCCKGYWQQRAPQNCWYDIGHSNSASKVLKVRSYTDLSSIKVVTPLKTSCWMITFLLKCPLEFGDMLGDLGVLGLGELWKSRWPFQFQYV